MYPSVPEMMVSVLAAQFPTARVCTELPGNLESVLPVLQVNRFGGSGDVLTMDRAYIDVDVWAATLGAAETLGSQVQTWMMLYLAGHRVVAAAGAGVFAKCAMQTGMVQRPSGNPDVKRVGAAFTVHVHSA